MVPGVSFLEYKKFAEFPPAQKAIAFRISNRDEWSLELKAGGKKPWIIILFG